MIGPFQCDTEGGTDPAGRNDSHLQPSRSQAVGGTHLEDLADIEGTFRVPTLRIPDGLTDTSVASALAAAATATSVLAAAATAVSVLAAAATATGRWVDLQPRHQIGDRVAAGVLARGPFHDEFCDVRFFSHRFFSDRSFSNGYFSNGYFSNRFGGRRFASPRGPAVTG